MKMLLKRSAAALSVLCLLFSLAACTVSSETAEEFSAASEAETESSENAGAEMAAGQAPAEATAEEPEEETPGTCTYRTILAENPETLSPLSCADDSEALLSWISTPLWYAEPAEDGASGTLAVSGGAAGDPEDVTAEYAGNEAYGVPEDAQNGYAWRISLNEALCWEDGTPVTADDYIYSLFQYLNPETGSVRTADYTDGSLAIANARSYYAGASGGELYRFYGELSGSTLAWADSMLEAGSDILYFSTAAYNSWLGDTFADYMAGTDELAAIQALTGGEEYVPVTEELSEALSALLVSWYGEEGTSYLPWLCFVKEGGGTPVLTTLREAGYSTAADYFADGGTLEDLYIAWEPMLGGDAVSTAPEYLPVTDTREWTADAGGEEQTFTANGLYSLFASENASAAEADVLGIWRTPAAASREQVGIVKNSDYSITLIFAAPVSAGVLQREFSIPLINETVYDNMTSEQDGTSVCVYGQDSDAILSCGPYRIESWDKDGMTLVRSESWFAFTENYTGWFAGRYQTDSISVSFSKSSTYALELFLQGSLESCSIDAEALGEYAGTDALLKTQESAVQVFIFNSDTSTLLDEDGNCENHSILSLTAFRRAVSLSLNRDTYSSSLNIASVPADMLFGSAWISDPATGTALRDTDAGAAAREAVFGTGGSYVPTLAADLFEQAYQEAKEAHLISGADNVVITFAAPNNSEEEQAIAAWLQECIDTASAGTSLEGRIEVRMCVDRDRMSSSRSGLADLILVTWSQDCSDPYAMLKAFLDPAFSLACGFDPDTQELTLTIEGTERSDTLSGWYASLTEGTYRDISAGVRTEILAALEQAVLETYTSIPVAYSAGLTLVSSRLENVGNGLESLTYTMNDEQWLRYCASLNYVLPYGSAE